MLHFVRSWHIINTQITKEGLNMGLNSTVVTINNLLCRNFPEEFQTFLGTPKKYFSIPDYQREYKWDKTKIKTFVSNVMTQSKFLGIITTEVPNGPNLSIVDGQQRLTTIMLLFAWLYNVCAEEGETETQDEIQGIISFVEEGQLRFILDNASVGTYLHFVTDANGVKRIKLEIDSASDIYKQYAQFSDAWNTIDATAKDICRKNPDITLDEYKQRLLDCNVLLFAQKNANGMQQGSIEEIYIDINEKSQKLDPEDIFKGHCFAICKTSAQQERVKGLWRSVKEQYFAMDELLTQANMNKFLHFYLLTQEATRESRKDINKELTIDGENIITQRYNTPTKVIGLITDIKQYQSNLIEFKNTLNRAQPQFENIMVASAQELGNNRDQLLEIQTIIKDILACKQNLFKLPLLFFIDTYMRKDRDGKLTYFKLSGFVYLYYFYMFLFARLISSRKREDLANGLINKIHAGQNFLMQFIKEIKSYSNGLDLELEEKHLKDQYARKHLYQILDNFHVTSAVNPAVDDSSLAIKMRLYPDAYNVEHLIVHKSHTITWISAHYTEHNPPANTKYEFTTDDFRTCQVWLKPNNQWANFIWIDETFNRENLKNFDIVTKVIRLRGNCCKQNPPADGTWAKKHMHIEMVCQHIMNTEGFDELYHAYQTNASREEVKNCYRRFIDNYFSEESTAALRKKLSDKFTERLTQLCQLVQ